MIYLVCVMCGIQSVLCAAFSLSYVRDLVCLMCSLQSVMCAVFSLCYVQFLVCVMCSLQFVLYVVFSLCYVQSSVCLMCSTQCLLLAAKAAHRSAPDSSAALAVQPFEGVAQITSVTEMMDLTVHILYNIHVYIYIHKDI